MIWDGKSGVRDAKREARRLTVAVWGSSSKYDQLTSIIRSMPRFNLSKISFFPLCFFLMAWLGGTLLVGCAPFASVGVVVPSPPTALVADQSTEELKQARSEMKVSEELAKTNPKEAIAQSEAAAMLSLDAQKNLSGPRADEVVAFYNYSVARLVEQTIASREKPWEREIQLAGPSSPLGLSLKSDKAGAYIPCFDRL